MSPLDSTSPPYTHSEQPGRPIVDTIRLQGKPQSAWKAASSPASSLTARRVAGERRSSSSTRTCLRHAIPNRCARHLSNDLLRRRNRTWMTWTRRWAAVELMILVTLVAKRVESGTSRRRPLSSRPPPTDWRGVISWNALPRPSSTCRPGSSWSSLKGGHLGLASGNGSTPTGDRRHWPADARQGSRLRGS